MKKVLAIAVILCVNTCSDFKNGNDIIPEIREYKLWYQQPAEKWNEALPVGNGRIGAMVFGRVYDERIQLNEESLWAGKKFNTNKITIRLIIHIRVLSMFFLIGTYIVPFSNTT